jgi:RNA polymerase sigma-70 factor, ECF subfamily
LPAAATDFGRRPGLHVLGFASWSRERKEVKIVINTTRFNDPSASLAEPPRRNDFAQMVEPFRAELFAHCRRILGSREDAEDQVQETFLRAWRSIDDFEGRSSLRTWLYRIATNVSLTALDRRHRRPLPSGMPGTVSDRDSDIAGWPTDDTLWWTETATSLEPADPAAVVISCDVRRRALLVAWRHLTPRQRTALMLHDVLSWSANEIAELLGTSDTAVHSVLARARTQLANVSPATDDTADPIGPSQQALLDTFARAFENGDVAALVQVMADDAMAEAESSSTAVVGRDLVARFLAECPGLGNSRMVPVTVNSKPGFAVYQPDADGTHRAYAIDVLHVTDSGIERIVVLEDIRLFAVLGLPETHEDGNATSGATD